MLPTSSNTSGPGCVPNSSDCIIWQGPNIPCINLCTGDSITDVTYKIAEKLCAVQSAYNLDSLQLNDLATFCTTIAGPPTGTNKTLLSVLDYIVKKLDCVNDKVDAIPAPTTPQQPTIELPTCLRYVSAGVQVNSLVHSAATLHIANEFCLLKSAVSTLSSSVADHELRIKTLEGAPTSVVPLVTPNCSYQVGSTNIPANVPVAMNILLDAVEADLCLFRQAVGSNTQIATAAATFSAGACPAVSNLSNTQALSKASGTTMAAAYGNLGWNTTIANLSQSIQNLWLTVLDMRCVINDLKNCCGQNDCGKFILDFDLSTNNSRTEVTLNFYNKSFLPGTGYSNSTGTDAPYIVIKDSSNKEIKITGFDLISYVGNTSGITIPVSGNNITNALNTASTYEVLVYASIRKDGTNCVKSLTKSSSPPCPTINQILVVS